ncbi:YbhB/YbcL family Raf kinase inhibitor-like protein [Ramlibacter rhizophilus]|uniref:YbhB/YbcL family Raf kinase inhibitor-like protein n=1 Tax=Ramlibacter rhizophilus TaxID=1781167 RepID=A0A4Z0BST4_9BURK|nr:YbhB/YbcL family Raf kinase inhibitor-like protein [Ramlibacter rhizophilus]TFZ01318.1 YbhB/YbcL family Raf kinase inhibitor-like protein [Ramlibacter rhizophilus]
MQLTSASIADGQIQQVHASRSKGGEDQPLSLTLHGVPAGARYLAIVADDPDAVKPTGKVWVHWNVFDVPRAGEVVDIRAGEALDGVTGRTTSGAQAYEGMAPPDGTHTYRFAVFASSDPLNVETGKAWTIDDFERAYGHRTLAKAQIEGRFG